MPDAISERVRDAQLHLVEEQRLRDGLPKKLDLPRGLVRDAEVAHLAALLELVERGRDLLGLHQRVGTVQQEHVEPVGLQRGERELHLGQDVLAGEVPEALANADLALDDDRVALARAEADRVSPAPLAAVPRRAVDVRVVEDVDPAVDGGADQCLHLRVIQLLDAHQAEHDAREREREGGDVDVLHGDSSVMRENGARRERPRGDYAVAELPGRGS